MTQLDECMDANQIETWRRNLEAIVSMMPELATTLQGYTPESKLVRDDNGDWDVDFRGGRLYGPDAKEYTRKKIELVKNNSQYRFYMKPMSTINMDSQSGDFLYRMMKSTTDSGFTFSERPTTAQAYHFVSFGFGLGHHMDELIEIAQPHSICIVEPNIDFIYHSLFTYDWARLLERRRKYGARNLSVITSSRASDIAQRVRHHMRMSCPVGVDGTLVFSTYSNDSMAAAASELARDGYMISIGLGFINDEMEMTRASYKNLRDGRYRDFKVSNIHHNVPAFIVGSGPSVDQDIEAIREFQDRAVIFSCGTAGRVLLSNGIQPDFQLILENGTNPYLALSGAQEQFGFDHAVLIASNTVDPRLKELFQDAVFFCRQALSSYALFEQGPEFNMPSPGPTVANTGLNAALSMGFRQIYLFGVDLGTRKQGRHHSRHSVYRHDDDDKAGVKGAFDYTDDYPLTEVGNFGGLVHTDLIMTWTRDGLAGSIGALGASVQVFNCSDGLLIPNTIPKSSAGIEIATSAAQKKKALETAIAGFPRGSAEEIQRRWNRDNWLERIRDLANQVSAIGENMPDTPGELLHQLTQIMIRDHERLPTHAEFFLRGTVLMMGMTIDYYWRRVCQLDRTAEFKELVGRALCDSMNYIVQQAAWFFDNLENFESYEELEERAKEWAHE